MDGGRNETSTGEYVPPPHDARRWLWSPSQCRAVAAVLLAGAALTGGLLWQRPVAIADPQPALGARHLELADRLDPNTATAAQLATLPGIGPSKAESIVAHRQGRGGGGVVFRRVGDLMRVHGIGPALAERMRPYLVFPDAGEG